MIRWAECPICHLKHSPTDNDLTSAPIAECPICRLKYAPTDNDLTSATADTYNFSLVITPPAVNDALEERLCALEDRVAQLERAIEITWTHNLG